MAPRIDYPDGGPGADSFWDVPDDTTYAAVTDPVVTPELEAQVRALAAQHGIAYDPSDALDVARNGGDINIAAAKYAQRASSNGRGGGDGGSFTFASPGGVSGAPQSIQPYSQTFAFDPSTLGQTDAFKFRFDKALEALKRSGASRGTYFNPQTWKAMEAEASGLASQELGAEYGRQADTFDRNYGVFRNNELDRFNSQRANRLDDFSFMDTNRRFSRGVYEDDRNFDYTRRRDDIGDQWRFIDYGYQSARNPRY